MKQKTPQELAADFPVYYTLSEVAQAARVTLDTVKLHRKKGYIRATRLVPNGRWMVARQDVLDYLAGKGVPA